MNIVTEDIYDQNEILGNKINYDYNTNTINTNTINTNTTMKKVNQYKKPKVTYDDILNSLNLKVNNGKLEYIQQQTIPNTHYDQFKTCYKKQCLKQQQLPSENKNSYIYNKYFKDYNDPTIGEQEQESIYITPQEYKKRVILEIIRRREERKRISEIKSKKLLFARNNMAAPTNASPNNLNKLFMFSKR